MTMFMMNLAMVMLKMMWLASRMPRTLCMRRRQSQDEKQRKLISSFSNDDQFQGLDKEGKKGKQSKKDA